MKIIDFDTIRKIDIPLLNYYKEIKELMLNKDKTILPAKTSMKLDGHIFYNAMPSIISEKSVAGVKVVTRYPE